MISAEALFQRAAKLPRIEVKDPGQVINRNTVSSMQSGMFYGYVGQVEGLVTRMKAEMGGDVTVWWQQVAWHSSSAVLPIVSTM